MPTIPIYTDKENIQIPERGIEAMATAGRRAGQLGQEEAAQVREGGREVQQGLGQIAATGTALYKHNEALDGQQDIIGVSSAAAGLQNSLAKQWDAVSKSGNPEDANNFLTNVAEPQIADLYGSAQTDAGRKYATEQAASLNMHWGNTINRGQAQMAGEAIVGNLNQVHDQLTNSVAVDPSHVPQALDQLKITYGHAAQAEHLTPEQSSILTNKALPEAQRDLITVGAKAAADKAAEAGRDPTAAMGSYLNTYGDRLGGDRVDVLQKYAVNRGKIATADADLKQRNDAVVAQNNSDQAIVPFFQKTLGGLTSGSHVLPDDTINQVMHSPTLTPATQEAYTAAVGKIANGTAATSTDPNTLDDTIGALLLPKGSKGSIGPTHLLTGVGQGALSANDAQFLMGADPTTLNHVSSALTFGRSYLSPTDQASGKTDPVKFNQYAQYQKWVMQHAEQGTLPDVGQLQSMVPAFKGYTVTMNAQGQPQVSWGIPQEKPGLISRAGSDLASFFRQPSNSAKLPPK